MKFIVTFVFILGISSSFAQDVVRVCDKSDLQPISNVTITNMARTLMVTTDEMGNADISGFSGPEMLFFSHVAYQSSSITKNEVITRNNQVFLVENIIKLDEFVFSANKTVQKKSTLPYKIEMIEAKDVLFNNPPTSPQMLEQTGNVFVQQSQLGGGSPVLRGFEANKVLLVVDGIRMNNAIYRAGHLQNAITVDPFCLESTEIIYGPGSTVYGSDALGGVISFRTQDPVLSTTGKRQVSSNVIARLASADIEKTAGINLNIGYTKLAVRLNVTYSDFEDLREGNLRNPLYGDFGKCLYYSDRINGKDSTVKNGNPLVQHNSGYSQYNLLGKALYKPNKSSSYLLNVQYSNSSDVPRYDRLSEMKNDSTMSFAEWYYGPQTRLLGSLKADYHVTAVIFDHASVILGYQKVNEDRIQRNFGDSIKKYNDETVYVYSVNADFDKRLCRSDNLLYGLEFDYNKVTSTAWNENIRTGVDSYDRATRYPDDHANTMSMAAYFSNTWNIKKILAFSQGIRFSYQTLNAAYSDKMVKILDIPFDPQIKQKSSAFTGYIGLVATPGRSWKFSLVGSTGFRAPNIDDLTKLNVVTGKTIVIPNPGLKPENAYNAELTVEKTIAGCVRIEGTGFYTWLRDAHVIQPKQYNGRDSIMMDGQLYQTLAPVNAGNAHIIGFQGSLLAQVTRSFSIVSNLTYTVGYNESDGTPLDHIPPFFGMTSFRLELKKFRGDFYVMYNGWKRISQYSTSGEDNEQYATAQGMPSWYTLNLKLSYQLIRNLGIEAGVENILDENYRKFASGISAPGRNVIVAVRANF